MTIFKQRDYPQQLGTCNTTIAREGCAIACCGILADKSPDYVNNLGAYVNGCLADWPRLALSLDLDYNSRRDIPVKYPCIAEVVLSGFQHFIVLVNENTQIDPWTGQEGELKYQILSYRNLSPKGETMSCFASREMNVGKIKEQLIYIRERLYALQPLTNKEYQERAERVADDNINLVGILKEEVKTDFFKYFMRKKDCVCPPDLSSELTETRRREKDNWDNLVKTMDERDKAEAELELCQKKVCPPCKQDCEVKVYEVCNGKQAKRIFLNFYWIK